MRLRLSLIEEGEGGAELAFEGEELAAILRAANPEAGASISAADLLRLLEAPGAAAAALARMATHRPESAALRKLAKAAGGGFGARPAKSSRAPAAVSGSRSFDPRLAELLSAPGGVRTLRPDLPYLDVEIWLRRLRECRNRICRVEVEGRAEGTGFLVGPSAVLTNWHVMARALAPGEAAVQGMALPQIRCRFDYLRLAEGRRSQGFAAALAQEALAGFAPCSPAELAARPNGPPPQAHELDFALLRLAEPLGLQEVEGAPRGFYALPNEPPDLRPDAALLILQHPGGAPMKLTLDTGAVIGPEAGGLRWRYRTNTEGGASGSPVFTLEGELALLHHFGDPGPGAPRFNQGLPLDKIRAAVFDAGAAGLLQGEG